MYDTHGMAAFEPNSATGMGNEVDLEDMLAQMFGMGGGSAGPGMRTKKPRKGPDEEQTYQITLEDLYKGKTVKFASTKQVICSHCRGTGGKEKAQSKECGSCNGKGEQYRTLAPARFSKTDDLDSRSQAEPPRRRSRSSCPRDYQMRHLQRPWEHL